MSLYLLVRVWARITMFFFFRKITVTHKGTIPDHASVIFAPNHQSAFLDPIVVAVNTRRKPWFLTRASVFKEGMVTKFLQIMHMIPVYRLRDMVDLKTANNGTFEFCHEKLLQGQSIMIFPEGNHGMQKRLRTPLKKGIGRIALKAAIALKNDPDREVVIVPVGINYEHPTGMRTDLLLNFGSPISLKERVKDKTEPEATDLVRLRNELALSLQELMIDIRPKSQYDEVEYAWRSQRHPSPSLEERFKQDKELIASLSGAKTLPPEQREPKHNGFLRNVLLVLGFPFWLLGMVLNAPFILGSRYLLDKVVNDTHFLQSIKFICIMVGVPLFTLITTGILYALTGWFWPFLLIIPLSGLLAYEYQQRLWYKPGLALTKDLAGAFLPED